MNAFTASNGITVFVRDGGTVQFQHGTREESCGILQLMPHSEWWQALREYFRAEEDERLGRWRFNENITARRDGNLLHVTDHSTGKYSTYVVSSRSRYSIGDYGLDHVARAYFESHPDPLDVPDGVYMVSKTWHPYERLVQRRKGKWHHLYRDDKPQHETHTAEEIARIAASEDRLTPLVLDWVEL